MKFERSLLIENIPNKPFAYEFIDDDFILIYSHSLMLLFSKTGEFITKFNKHNNGRQSWIKKITPQLYMFGNNVLYDNNWNISKKKFKIPKKSLEQYWPTYGPRIINLNNEEIIILGFLRGMIGLYNQKIEPICFKQLDKNEYLIQIIGNKAFTKNEKNGIITLYNLSDFKKEEEFKINKQSRELIITENYIFNSSYTSTNDLINLTTGKTDKIQFHPTTKRGYKEQYSGPHNFGTQILSLNNSKNKILARTDRNKCLTFDFNSKEIIELKIHDILQFDKFEYSFEHTMYCGFFKEEFIYTNAGEKFIVWDKVGNVLFSDEKIDNINIDKKGQIYSLDNHNLYYLNKV